jgi:hypothetical protein
MHSPVAHSLHLHPLCTLTFSAAFIIYHSSSLPIYNLSLILSAYFIIDHLSSL